MYFKNRLFGQLENYRIDTNIIKLNKVAKLQDIITQSIRNKTHNQNMRARGSALC